MGKIHTRSQRPSTKEKNVKLYVWLTRVTCVLLLPAFKSFLRQFFRQSVTIKPEIKAVLFYGSGKEINTF